MWYVKLCQNCESVYIFSAMPDLWLAQLRKKSSVQLLSRVRLFATPWTTSRQASLSITNSRSLFRLMSIESMMPSNHLILGRPLLLLPSIFPSIRVFSNESALRIGGPKDWSLSLNISPSNEHSGPISIKKKNLWDFPGSPVVRTWRFPCSGPRFSTRSGN